MRRAGAGSGRSISPGGVGSGGDEAAGSQFKVLSIGDLIPEDRDCRHRHRAGYGLADDRHIGDGALAVQTITGRGHDKGHVHLPDGRDGPRPLHLILSCIVGSVHRSNDLGKVRPIWEWVYQRSVVRIGRARVHDGNGVGQPFPGPDHGSRGGLGRSGEVGYGWGNVHRQVVHVPAGIVVIGGSGRQQLEAQRGHVPQVAGWHIH